MPKQINQYQVGQSLVRRFGLKGRYQPVLDEVVVPVVSVGETEPEDVRLATGGVIRAAAGAGNQNICYLSNPPGSGVLMRLTSFTATSGAPTTDFLQVGPIALALTTPGVWRDSRIAGTPAGAVGGAAPAAAVLGTPQFHLDNDDTQWFVDWVLDPGAGLFFRQNGQNTTLVVSWFWQETNLTATSI